MQKPLCKKKKMLQNYFLSNNVAPHLQEYSMLFGYFEQSKDETFTKTIQLKPEKIKRKNWKWLSVAASVVLLFSMYMGYGYYQQRQAAQKYAEITEALQLVSFNLNKSNEAVESLYAYENTVNKILKTK